MNLYLLITIGVTKWKTLKIIVTIQPPPNQLDNIDFDVIDMSDY